MRLHGIEVTTANAVTLLDQLVQDQVAEDELLEFKVALPDRTDVARDEFMRDVAAFANHRGGTLVYGVAEVNGVASKVLDLGIADTDAEMRRLEAILQGIQPRLHVEMVPIRHANGLCMLLGVPRSVAAPHMVLGPNRLGQYWVRGVAGKVLMDSAQVRRAILEGSDWFSDVERFRGERLRFLAHEAGHREPLAPLTALLVHVLPLGGPRDHVDLSAISSDWQQRLLSMLRPFGSYQPRMQARPNLHGWFAFLRDQRGTRHCQCFRAGGGIEVRWDLSVLDTRVTPGRPFVLSGETLETWIVDRVARSFDWFRIAKVDPPYGVAITLAGCADATIQAGGPTVDSRLKADYAIDESTLLLPVLILDARPQHVVRTLAPTFDILWQAASWPRSPYHHPNGDATYTLDPTSLTW